MLRDSVGERIAAMMIRSAFISKKLVRYQHAGCGILGAKEVIVRLSDFNRMNSQPDSSGRLFTSEGRKNPMLGFRGASRLYQ